MRKLKAIAILNGYQATVNIVVGNPFNCPDGVTRRVREISDTATTGKYAVRFNDDHDVVVVVNATNVLEQVN